MAMTFAATYHNEGGQNDRGSVGHPGTTRLRYTVCHHHPSYLAIPVPPRRGINRLRRQSGLPDEAQG